MFSLLKKIFGTANDRVVKKLQDQVIRINDLEKIFSDYSDDQLKLCTNQFKEKLDNGASLDDILNEAFAVVREASKRELHKRHFDEQLIGGIILHRGMIAEMRTGEGKTLVSTLPGYLNSLTGEGVHIVTVNDYLAKRDSQWMKQVYEFLGVSVGCILGHMEDSQRITAYNCDVTYATNNELGFDFLRDNMKFSLASKTQRSKINYAIIDEVDSILIDEARTPLVISGPSDDNSQIYITMNKIIKCLDKNDYEKDEKVRSVTLNDDAIGKLEEEFVKTKLIKPETSLYDVENIHLVHYVNQCLKAQVLFSNNVNYIVQNNKVKIIDEFTGRISEGRRFSEGLHQALEAKENVKIENENQTLASITFQNYFRMYKKLSGMTGTAMTEADELKNIYSLDVVAIPPHRKFVRIDHNDSIYGTKIEKNAAILQLIKESHAKGQPILIGTVSIEDSEKFSSMLKDENIEHKVLNAKFHEQEATIIAEAGSYGKVTIATNMAGRGTDIILGGNPEIRYEEQLNAGLFTIEAAELKEKINQETQVEHEKVIAAGGLFVIGTERHESRRIDNQLRGRAGRQGDPGSSKFFLSLEDDLMRIFASDRVSDILRRLGLKGGEAIHHPLVNRALAKAQQKVEAHNYEIRKNLLKFDDVMNDQRNVIYSQRNAIIASQNLEETFVDLVKDSTTSLVTKYVPSKSLPEDWDLDGLIKESHLIFNLKITKEDILNQETLEISKIIEFIDFKINQLYTDKKENFGFDMIHDALRYIMIVELDQLWKDHLHNLDHLRQGISLRAYGQKDPLNEYKKEAFHLFTALLTNWGDLVVNKLCFIHMERHNDEDNKIDSFSLENKPMHKMHKTRQDPALQLSGHVIESKLSKPKPYVNIQDRVQEDPSTWGRVSRNEPCPCGSGKKYKACHGAS